VNLGWKLGAALGGWGPDWLLDSYSAERHPVGAGVLALSGRQFRLNTVRSPARRALRWAVHRLVVPLPPVQARLARDYSGISIAYPPAGLGASPAHPLAGRRLPRGAVTLSDGRRVRLAELFPGGTFVLLDGSAAVPAQAPAGARGGEAGGALALGASPVAEAGRASAGEAGPVGETSPAPGGAASPAPAGASNGVLAEETAGRIAIVPYRATTAPGLPASVLVRPDGYIAWASDEPDPAARAAATRAAIHLWCCPGVLTSPG